MEMVALIHHIVSIGSRHTLASQLSQLGMLSLVVDDALIIHFKIANHVSKLGRTTFGSYFLGWSGIALRLISASLHPLKLAISVLLEERVLEGKTVIDFELVEEHLASRAILVGLHGER